jgi:multidrug efflux system outer membrane protein
MRALSLMALPLLGACSLAPTYHRPASPVPPSWPVGDAYLAQSERTLPEVSYSDIFRDPRLQQIISQAIANNRDLRIAAANIVQARAQYRIQRAEILPVIDASAGAGYSDNGGASSTGTGTGTGATGRRASFSADIGTTAFEVDLFGRIRSLSDAALNRYFASEAAARATRLTLTGDIADAWLAYAADQSLLAIAAQTVASATKSVELTRRRLEGGIAPRTDLRQAETVLATAQADLAAQRTAIAQDLNALQLLVGAPIDPALLPQSIEEAGTTLAELPAGLDSGILLRRPDVVEAEYQLRAANAEIGAARAELFPRISLTGLAGFASDALSRLFTGDAFGWQGAGTASYSIFRAGAGGANVTASKAQHDALLAAYEKSIQTAFREVADALARRGTIDDQVAANNRLVSAAEDNYRLTEARYRGGIDSFLTSLDAQRSLYTAQRSLVTVRLAKAGNLVALYRALGGDALSYTL